MKSVLIKSGAEIFDGEYSPELFVTSKKRKIRKFQIKIKIKIKTGLFLNFRLKLWAGIKLIDFN